MSGEPISKGYAAGSAIPRLARAGNAPAETSRRVPIDTHARVVAAPAVDVAPRVGILVHALAAEVGGGTQAKARGCW